MLSAILLLGIAVILSLESIRLCKRFPWRTEFSHLHWGLGAVLAPFIWGLTLLLAMSLTPGSSGILHLALSFIFFFLTTRSVTLLLPASGASKVSPPATHEKHRWVFIALAATGFILFMLALTTTPLTQNDGLEYLIVGKHLFQTHDIFLYPLISPEKNPLNFYGPWTHPPLYPALLYAANLIQDNIYDIGLTRWISPWFYLSSIFLVAAITWRSSKNLALLSFTLCLSVPLWSLGATTALIDASTLSAYIALFVAVCALKPDQKSYPLIVGMISGFGMWAHSQAVLNPLVFGIGFLYLYRTMPGRYIKNSLIAGCTAILIGGIYYIRNTVLFGNPIKDASPVAQLSGLDMNPYFMVSRGYYHFIDVLRFGYLKMWFNYEAYNLIPWIFLFALSLYICSTLKPESSKNSSFLNLSLLITLGLFASIVAISLLGTAHYIKNERYQMILLPLMICFAMQTLALNPIKSRNVKIILQGLLGLTFTLSLAGQILFLKKSWAEPKQSELRKSFMETSAFLRSWKDLSLNGKILSYKPADSFLNDIPTTSHVDPVLIPLYQIKDAAEAWAWLKANKFGYVYVPTYIQPTEYNTALIRIIGNPAYTKLLGEGPESQLYQINQTASAAEYVSLKSIGTQTEALITLGGRKDLLTIPLGPLKGISPVIKYLRELTQQQSTTFSLEGRSLPTSEPLVLKTQLAGFGRVSLHAAFLDKDNQVIKKTNLPDIALMNPKVPFTMERQFFVPSGTHNIVIKVKSRGLDYTDDAKVDLFILTGTSSHD
ncbi:hypothetical protein AZI85_16005 [Bdellovibrio bacteriovorus]|uniref:Glycosyltransferase RgtA/B/C/D-like domain-containing protein n=1 Tax=Bdellovibrio bacteriovorus TaxID=959 RepID=A0A150WU40_BDEBC|nr:hypothetical protein [Bdellovibrio bacteriovorus]KYG69896.1 hypothetical protein AZI85_16005 [Bdellovibrio bacteriovorus]